MFSRQIIKEHTSNLQLLIQQAGVEASFTLIRTPSVSEMDDVITYADDSNFLQDQNQP